MIRVSFLASSLGKCSRVSSLVYSAHSFPCYPHFTSLTFATLTNLAPLAIKPHLTSTSSNLSFHCYPDVRLSLTNLTCLSPPLHFFLPLLQLLIFILFLVTSHGTNMPTSLLSFSSLSIPSSHNHPSLLLPHVTRTIHNHPKLSPAFLLLPPTCSNFIHEFLLPFILPGCLYLSRASSPHIFIFLPITSYGTNLASSPHSQQLILLVTLSPLTSHVFVFHFLFFIFKCSFPPCSHYLYENTPHPKGPPL